MDKTVLMYHGNEVSWEEAQIAGQDGFSVDWAYHLNATLPNIENRTFTIKGNAELNAIESGLGRCGNNNPSCKCAYCGCTNDHIYGTCDYCGAPLEG